ncbi:MAG: PUA domain-containing protein [Halobacteriales archaeon]
MAGVEALRTVADYQFGRGAGAALFPPEGSLEIDRSRSGRPRQLFGDDGRIATYTVEGRLVLGLEGGYRLRRGLEAPAYRVAVGEESAPHVRDGRNAFAKFVRSVDPDVRRGDEVLVVDRDGDLLAVGRAELSATAMADFETGVAVMVRRGA